VRIASFNVENLFSRARALNQETIAEGKVILAAYSRLNSLLESEVYTDAIKAKILEELAGLGLSNSDESKFVILRQNHGRLVRRPSGAPPDIVAAGRSEWIGWLDLKKEAVNEVATRMTAKVIQDVNADILAVIEAEDRIALTRFNKQLLAEHNVAYDCIMLIDGNDERGIDVGLLTKSDANIGAIVSHVDDSIDGERIFSRDCPEFTVTIDGMPMLVLVNHLKSKGYGTPAQSNARRKLQAERVRAIYDQRRAEGVELIAILGDFNDTPASDPLSPLLGNGTDLRDIFEHPSFDDGGRPGTYGTCSASNKIDYILLSPKLFERVVGGGVWRKGVWGGANGTIFPHYAEITKSIHAASDHAAVWADFDLNP